MRSTSWLGRAFALTLAATAVATTPARAEGPALIPALQIDGRGFGHGVGMAQDGALAMGQAGATLAQILNQFYPGTALGKAGGPVRVPVYAGNNVELLFPDGGEVRGNAGTLRFAPGAAALVSREGDATRVKPVAAAPPPTTSTSTSTSTTTTSTSTTTTTAPAPLGVSNGQRQITDPVDRPSTTTTTPPPTTAAPSPGLLYSGAVTAAPNDGGRVAVVPRGRRYRGVMELSPTGGRVRFVNQVPVETYLRGMGEVRNPKWPQASLQAQAVAARTYAMRAMAVGGELCDTQRCQVYIGSDAEYAAMDKAVAATAGQVLTFGRGLASAVYSANGGGHSANAAEGFGQPNPSGYPYLRAAPYLCTNPAAWSVSLALTDVARRLNYRGTISGVEIAERGPSGRATRIVLRGDKGDVAVTGLAFDAALGLKSTLFTLRTTMAASVESIQGGSILQAPPEQAAAVGAEPVASQFPPAPVARAVVPRLAKSSPDVGLPGAAALVLWAGVVGFAVWTRRRTGNHWRAHLS